MWPASGVSWTGCQAATDTACCSLIRFFGLLISDLFFDLLHEPHRFDAQ